MDETIRITSDECARATPLPPADQTYPNYPDSSINPPPVMRVGSDERSKPVWPWVLCGVAALLVMMVVVAAAILSRVVPGMTGEEEPAVVEEQQRTTDDLKSEVISALNETLENPDAAIRKRVESAHVTVSVTSAYVKDCTISTRDGTNLVGMDDSNVSQIAVVVRCEWKGIVDTGSTDIKVVMPMDGSEAPDPEIVRTDALVNTEDPEFWRNVGHVIRGILEDM